MTTIANAPQAPSGRRGKVSATFVREFRNVLPLTIYFFGGSNLILSTNWTVSALFRAEGGKPTEFIKDWNKLAMWK